MSESNTDRRSGTSTEPSPLAAPAVELPRGGGAIRGVGETVSVNNLTGAASVQIPIRTSATRASFMPELAIVYDSAAGNGSFGVGWSLGVPAITRKTDKGIPRYRDEDVFLLSGAEDLVPIGEMERDGYRVRRYRPRVEQAFDRIERWTRISDGEIHWRSFSRDNVASWYGLHASTRIVDPADRSRVFSWLLDTSFDGKGNAVIYEYVGEPGDANRYLKAVKYGNRVPVASEVIGGDPRWMFELRFDYGDEHYEVLPEDAAGRVRARYRVAPGERTGRADPFSSYRSGFEIRTRHLCRRVFQLHHFPDELGCDDYLVSSTELEFLEKPTGTFLSRAVQAGYVREGDSYLKKTLPPLELAYTENALDHAPAEAFPLQTAPGENLPEGIEGAQLYWLDLDGEGIPGVLTQHAAAWYYQPNRGQGRLGPIELVRQIPAIATPGSTQQFLDVDGDGRLDLVEMSPNLAGFHERTRDSWSEFRRFRSWPVRDISDPNLRFVDLTGDGLADVLITEDNALVWHPSLLEDGYGDAVRVRTSIDDNDGPRVVFDDGDQTIFLADMSGDGLVDLVRIRNGEICYWPNLGYGRFGAKVNMRNAPRFADRDQFDPRRIRLADVDGFGTTDVLYLGAGGVDVYLNESGNSWSAPRRLPHIPTNDATAISVVDFLGRGTACIVVSSPLPADTRRTLRYVDLTAGIKPHLLTSIVNNMGSETRLHHVPSTEFYLADQRAGRPWVARLPFPVHVVGRIETHDLVSHHRYASTRSYHHGYFDGVEREFRGFGCIEQIDADDITLPAENLDARWRAAPVLTKSWFHTGIFEKASAVSRHMAHEYYVAGDDLLLDDTLLPDELAAVEAREACRALKGSLLRRETYALDASDVQSRPYTVTETSYRVRMIERPRADHHGVFFVSEHERLKVSYERTTDPRVTHDVFLAVDEFGNPTQTATVSYGRAHADPTLEDVDRVKQQQTNIALSESVYTEAVDTATGYRTPLPAASRKYEVQGISADARRFQFTELADKIARASRNEIPYEASGSSKRPARRLLQASRVFYRSNDLRRILPLRSLESLALAGVSYNLAFTPGLIDAVYQRDGRPVFEDLPRLLEQAGYDDLDGDGHAWMRSGRVFYSPNETDDAMTELAFARAHFFQRHRYTDALGTATFVRFDRHDLLHVERRDALGNTVTAENDYRALAARSVTDTNGNRTAAAFDELGVSVATAAMGKVGEQVGDTLDGLDSYLTDRAIADQIADPLANGPALIAGAGSRVIYDLFAFHRTRDAPQPQPVTTWTIVRETHARDSQPDEVLRFQHSFAYTDGLSRSIQTKDLAPPGPDERWLTSGWKLFDNKANAVRQYEAFYSATQRFEPDARRGISATLIYDPLGRAIATMHPDHSYEKVVFDPWRLVRWDVNDTVLLDATTDPDVGAHIRRLPPAEVRPNWYERRIDGALGSAEQRAAEQTARHAGTPTATVMDALGQPIVSIDWNRTETGDEYLTQRSDYDIEGQQRAVYDSFGRRVMTYDFNVMGMVIRQNSAEAGERWMFGDALGKGVRSCDARGVELQYEYDVLLRPTRLVAIDERGKRVVEEIEYGETQPDAARANLRGKTYRHRDTAGISINAAFDFKGNLLRNTRQFLVEYEETVDWSASPRLEDTLYATSGTYDGINRPVAITTADGSATRPLYDQLNQVASVSVRARDGASTTFVEHIRYNARGQRVEILLGNGVRTSYAYDPLTFRLTRLETRRTTDGAILQDLRYTYDAVGNVVLVDDAAQQTTFFKNQVVSPNNRFTYDAIYRLVHAEGRELVGLTTDPADREYHGGQVLPADGQALRRYHERYRYDAAGNILELVHDAGGVRWHRSYAYAADSNQLESTTLGSHVVSYQHDRAGNMTCMPHLRVLGWDFGGRLQRSVRQVAHTTAPETTHYVYDGAGNRMRKIVTKSGRKVAERIYLGFYEPYREYGADGNETLARDTLHLTDGQRRIAMIETERGRDSRTRYQLGNNLDSAALELDDRGAVISYEEYYPYGSTSYELTRGAAEVSAKRYRYLGRERDEETGLYFHGARYYASWLGRWISSDPTGLAGGANLYAYGNNCPTTLVDPNGRQPNPPVLMDNWTYGVQVPNRSTVGMNVQIDHPVWVSLRIQQRTAPGGMCYYNRGISAAAAEQGVLVETGRGLFHTELGKLQRGIRDNVLAGVIQGEAETMLATRQAYASTSALTGQAVNWTAVDTALVSNQSTLNRSMAQTVNELLALPPGGSTMAQVTEESMQACFAETFQIAPEATNASLQASTETLAADVLSGESRALANTGGRTLASEAAPLASAESELASSEAGLLAGESGLVCRAAGAALAVGASYLSIKAAANDFEEGDNVGGVLNLTTLVGLVSVEAGMVTAPLAGTWEGVKSGGKLMKMSVDCAQLGYAFEMGEINWDNMDLQGCMNPLMMDRGIINDVNAAMAEELGL